MPVMNDASSEARNNTPYATSIGLPSRRSGVVERARHLADRADGDAGVERGRVHLARKAIVYLRQSSERQVPSCFRRWSR